MGWDEVQITEYVKQKTSQEIEGSVEGPAILGVNEVWRVWTSDGKEYHAHYVVGDSSTNELVFCRNFQPFANWLTKAFSAKDRHERALDWVRNLIAAIITLTLLGLVVWAVLKGQASTVDFRWLVTALATTSLGYLLGGWTRRK